MTRPVVAVLDYGIGNLRSAQKGLEKAGAEAHITADPAVAAEADGVILPGVGNFGRCMHELRLAELDKVALDTIEAGRPFMGICVGMQMLYEGSDESPDVPGLGVLPGRVRLLPDSVKRPQMQWNVLTCPPERATPDPVLEGLDGAWVYFVHSYAAEVDQHCVATTDYGRPVVGVTRKDNVVATQFHPEKSGNAGLRLLRNFVNSLNQPN